MPAEINTKKKMKYLKIHKLNVIYDTKFHRKNRLL